MAKIDDYLNFTVLGYFYNRIKTVFADATEFQALSDKVDEIISEGGEPNVIEVVKVNGTALTPVNKAVDVEVPTDLSDLTNTSADPYATESYVDENGGKIDVIKVNGTTQTITNKEVDLEVPEITNTGVNTLQINDGEVKNVRFVNQATQKYVNLSGAGGASFTSANLATIEYVADHVPSDLSDLTNTGQDPYAQMSDVEAAQVGALKPKGSVAFANLPALTAANLNTYYNVTDSFTTTADFIEGAGKTYPAGTNVSIINTGTDASPVYKYDAMVGMIDLSGYWDKTELVAITTAQVDSLFS